MYEWIVGAAYDTSNSHADGSFMIPSAVDTNAWQLWLCAALYLLVALGGLAGFLQAIQGRGTFFRASFLGVAFLFGLIRGVLLIGALRARKRASDREPSRSLARARDAVYVPNWERHMFWLYLGYFFTPIFLQYWMFSLLILFVIKCIFVIDDREDRVRFARCLARKSAQLTARVPPAGQVVPLPVLPRAAGHTLPHLHHHLARPCQGLRAARLDMRARPPDPQRNACAAPQKFDSDNADVWDRNAALYVAILYGLLAFTGVYYSYRSYAMLSLATSIASSRKERLQKFIILIPVYFSIFFLRFVWGVLYYAGFNPIMNTIETYIQNRESAAPVCVRVCAAPRRSSRRAAENHRDYYTSYLIFYSMFETLPTALVVYIFTLKLGSPRMRRRASAADSPGVTTHETSFGTMRTKAPIAAPPPLTRCAAPNGLEDELDPSLPAVQSSLMSPADPALYNPYGAHWNSDTLEPLFEQPGARQ
jgi:hypothetical protein